MRSGFLIIASFYVLANPVKGIADPAYFGELDATIIASTGCISSDNVPVPGTANLFVGRQYFKRDGSLTTLEEGCGKDDEMREAIHSNRWGVVLEQLDWLNKRFSIIKPLVRPMTLITDGPIKGANIKTAYDADMVFYHEKYLIAFECTILNAPNYRIYGTAACVGFYNPATQQVQVDGIYVVVSGQHIAGKYHSVSVPQLLVFKSNLFLYWSEITIEQGKFTRIGVRGAQLEVDGAGFYWIKGVGEMAYSTDPSTIEVWGPDPRDPIADTAVDIKSIWVHGTEIVALGGLGGGGCAAPGPQPGCFRMALAKTFEALGDRIFNRSPSLDVSELPTNPQTYTRPIRNADNGYSLIGNFIRPTKNGYSETRALPADWMKAAPYQILVFAFPDKQLWPTE